MINDENFEQEAQQLIERISEAKNASFFELAKIAELDLLKDFAGSDMSGTNLSNEILRDADLRGTDLRNADLRGTDLRNADLRDADLRGAKLQRAILIDVKVKGAKFDWLSLDLSEDIKLTLRKQGAIFENFLKSDSVSLENQKMKEYRSSKMERYEEMNTSTTGISSLPKYKDGLTAVISSYEAEGRYLDEAQLARLKALVADGEIRIQAVALITANASTIIKRAVAQSLLNTDVTKTGGNMYGTRSYAACLRDLDIFLRYCTYALLSGDAYVLDERVLNGLKETYISLGVPIMPTINAIQSMKEISISLIDTKAGEELGTYLDYICAALA